MSVRSPVSHLRTAYGAGPVHLLAQVLALSLAAYTVVVLGPAELWDPAVWWQSIAVWFVGAAIAHDLVLFPLYASADRLLSNAVSSPRGRAGAAARPKVSPRNHVRVPVLASLLLFGLFLPGIVQQGADDYATATGQTQDPFLVRWLLLSAAFCAVSALVWIARLRLARRRPPPRG